MIRILAIAMLCVGAQVYVGAKQAAQTTAAPQDGRTPTTCAEAADPDYGLTAQKAVRIGGGALYMAARQRRYLEALRGPEGQEIAFRRTGTTATETNGTPIDMWEITWPGQNKPVTLYLFAYLYGEPKVPKGFTCVGFRLGNPPIDGFLSNDLQNALAVEQGSTADFAPISLDPDGTSTNGVMFDRFRLIARAAKTAAAAGTPLDPKQLPKPLQQGGLVIIAFPKKCGTALAAPTAIEVVSTRSGPINSLSPLVPHGKLDTLVPGYAAPADSAGIVVALMNLRPDDHVRVLYDAAVCTGDSRGSVFSAKVEPNRGRVMPEPGLPAGATTPDEALWLQAVVDLEGKLRRATRIGGPDDKVFVDQALRTLLDWQADPARVNGSPVVSDTHLLFRFQK